MAYPLQENMSNHSFYYYFVHVGISSMSQSISRPKSTAHLTQEQVEQFVNDGFVVVPGLIDPDRVHAGLKELKDKASIVPDKSTTWPKDKSGMHVGQEGIAFDRSVCISPQMEAVVQELTGSAVTCERGLGPILRFPQPGSKQFEPGGAHIDGTRQGNGITMYPTHFHLLVMGYLTDTNEHDGAFTVWPGSPRQVFEWAYCNDMDLGEKWRTTGSTGAPDIPFNDPIPVVAKAGDVAICHYLMVHASSANRGDHVRVGLHGWLKAASNYHYVPRSGPPQNDWTPVDWVLRTDNLQRVEVA